MYPVREDPIGGVGGVQETLIFPFSDKAMAVRFEGRKESKTAMIIIMLIIVLSAYASSYNPFYTVHSQIQVIH